MIANIVTVPLHKNVLLNKNVVDVVLKHTNAANRLC